MMIFRKTRAIICLICVMLISVCVFLALQGNKEVNASTADRFSYQSVKYKPVSEAPSNKVYSNSRKGLLLYAYDSGARAELKGVFSGQFDAELKASSRNSSSPDLMVYSIIFTNIKNQQSFALMIEDKGAELETYVCVDNDCAGIYYNYMVEWNNKPYGYTKLQNDKGNYTSLFRDGVTSIRFDPVTMQVFVMDKNDSYVLVWDFLKNIIDGKNFDHVLSSMDLYSVAFELTSIKMESKGELVIYSINGEDYGKSSLPSINPTISVNSSNNAIKGEKYNIPSISVCDFENKISQADVQYRLYNDNGTIVASGNYSDNETFTATEGGKYYLYYFAQDNNGRKAEAYTKFLVLNENEVYYDFIEAYDDVKLFGLNSSLFIPKCRFVSNLIEGNDVCYATANVYYNDSVIISETNDIKIKLDKKGDYKIVYTFNIYGKTFKSSEIIISVLDAVVGVDVEEPNFSMFFNETFNIPTATIYYDGKSDTATHKVKYPDGRLVNDDIVKLDVVGKYIIEYSYSISDKNETFTKEFIVEYKPEDLFGEKYESSIVFNEAYANADMPGIVATFNKNSSYITYDVDLSDNTKNDMLINFMAVASYLGVHDCNGFYVTLTDKLDRTNFVTIRMYAGNENVSNATFIKAKAWNQYAFTGWYKDPDWSHGEPYPYKNQLETAMNHNSGGFLNNHNFGSNTFGTALADCTIQLQWDTQEKALYANNSMVYVAKEDRNEHLVVDFDDTACFSNLWGGFTDNSQVELKISPIGLTNPTTIQIFEVDGNKFNNVKIIDKQSPNVIVDFEGMNEAPIAKVGAPYKIFNLKTSDNISNSECIKTDVSVKFGSIDIAVNNGTFTPVTAGTYSIIYTVSDTYGNSTIKRVNVTCRDNVDAISMSLESDWQEKAYYGFAVNFPKYSGIGGTGKYYYSVKVNLYGEEIETQDGYFIPLKEGRYDVTLFVKDYVGQTAQLTNSYDVNFSSEFVIDEDSIILPSMFIENSTYVFSEYYAGYYEALNSEKKIAKASIEVIDAKGTTKIGADCKYVASYSLSSQNAKVRIIFEANVSGNKISRIIEKIVPILHLEDQTAFMTKYFVTENAKVSAKNSFITFEAVESNKNVKATFIRPVCAQEFAIQFKQNIVNEVLRTDFDGILITLTDKNDPSIRVELTIKKNGDALQLMTNGKNEMFVLGSLTKESILNIQLSYDNTTFAMTGVENSTLGNVKDTVYGEKFNGFTSNELYVSFELLEVGDAENCAINLVQINNNRFINTIRDTGAPQVYVYGSYSGMYESGSKIILPIAKAYDVLNYTSDAVVSVMNVEKGSFVKALDGTVLDKAPANIEYTIKLLDVGRYVVSYYSIDEAGRDRNMEKSIVIMDNVLPTVELKNKLPERVWVGTKISIGDYTKIDNGNVDKMKVSIFYRDPNGVLYDYDESKGFIAEVQGKYEILFYMIDENEMYNVQYFEITAVNKG